MGDTTPRFVLLVTALDDEEEPEVDWVGRVDLLIENVQMYWKKTGKIGMRLTVFFR